MNKFDLSRKWGILDPEGEGYNPLTGREYKNFYIKDPEELKNYKDYAFRYENGEETGWSTLPVYEKAKEIITEISNRQIILAVAGTGSGKTVLLPKFALHTLNYKGRVLVTIPQTTSVETTAKYAAKCMDVKLGNKIGYFHGQTDSNFRGDILNYTTTGSFTKILQNPKDPYLKRKENNYNIIIIDEAHQRAVEMDELLLLVKQLAIYRPDIKIIIMTATVDINLYTNYYKDFNFKVLELDGGTNYSIQENWLSEKTYYDYKNNTKVHPVIVNTIIKILKNGKKDGHILVFVKSANEASNKICKLLNDFDKDKYCWLCTKLESRSKDRIEKDLGISETDLAINDISYLQSEKLRKGKKPCRKIIISTNIAESSLTVKNVDYIIDCGTAWVSSYDPNKQVNELNVEFVAKSSIIQRKGRTGRTRPGEWFPLYHKSKFMRNEKFFSNFPVPDIQKVDLTGELLSFLDLPNIRNIQDLRNFLKRLIEPAKEKFISSGLKILSKLGAVTSAQDHGTITNFGKLLKSLKIELIYAYCLVSSYFNNCFDDMSRIIACCVQINGKIELLFQDDKSNYKKYISEFGDHLTLLNVYKAYELNKNKSEKILQNWCSKNKLNFKMLKKIEKEGSRNNLDKIVKNFNKVKQQRFKDENKFSLFSTKKFIKNNLKIKNTNLRTLKCLFDGLNTNISIKINTKQYITIFPIKKSMVDFDKNSFCNKKNFIYFYDRLFDFNKFGPGMKIISSIPPTLIKYMKFNHKLKLKNAVKTFKNQISKKSPVNKRYEKKKTPEKKKKYNSKKRKNKSRKRRY